VSYQTAAILMTLSDLQSHSPTASLLACNFFSYSNAAIDKISTNLGRRAVPLRQLSFSSVRDISAAAEQQQPV